MSTVYMTPVGQALSTTVEGRTYSANQGQVIPVPDFDAPILTGNGWQQLDLNNIGQSTGWGTPINGAVQANFNGSTATLAQTSAAVAQLIIQLQQFGLCLP